MYFQGRFYQGVNLVVAIMKQIPLQRFEKINHSYLYTNTNSKDDIFGLPADFFVDQNLI